MLSDIPLLLQVLFVEIIMNTILDRHFNELHTSIRKSKRSVRDVIKPEAPSGLGWTLEEPPSLNGSSLMLDPSLNNH